MKSLLFVMNENWCEILDILTAVYKSDLRNETLVNAVENSFRVLGWKKSNKSMQRNYRTKSGRIVDLVLCEQNSDNVFLPVLPVVIDTISDKFAIRDKIKQIIQDLNLSVVMVFTNGIYLYFNETNMLNPKCVCKLVLEQDNNKGIEFFDLLSIYKINKKSLYDFCQHLIPGVKDEEVLLNILRTPAKIKEIVKEYVLNQGFDKNIVEKDIENIRYQIVFSGDKFSKENRKDVPHENKKNMTSKHDTTKFSFDGIHFYSKKLFVLNVIKQYVKEHEKISYPELERIFPSEIISKKRGVVRPLSLVQEWVKQNPDLERRYCMAPSEVITLHDGLQLVVYNQWGNQFHRFLEIADKFYKITNNQPKGGYVQYNTEQDISSGIQISEESLQDFSLKK